MLTRVLYLWVDSENSISGSWQPVFRVINVFYYGSNKRPREAFGPRGSNLFSRGPVPVFLRKPIASGDFQGNEVCTPCLSLDPPMITKDQLFIQSELPRPIPWNSVESDLGCTSRIYFDNVALTLHNVTLTSQIRCQHNNKDKRL